MFKKIINNEGSDGSFFFRSGKNELRLKSKYTRSIESYNSIVGITKAALGLAVKVTEGSNVYYLKKSDLQSALGLMPDPQMTQDEIERELLWQKILPTIRAPGIDKLIMIPGGKERLLSVVLKVREMNSAADASVRLSEQLNFEGHFIERLGIADPEERVELFNALFSKFERNGQFYGLSRGWSTLQSFIQHLKAVPDVNTRFELVSLFAKQAPEATCMLLVHVPLDPEQQFQLASGMIYKNRFGMQERERIADLNATREVTLTPTQSSREFLDKTLPEIEWAKVVNALLQQENPFFQANSEAEGVRLMTALFGQNYNALRALTGNPNFLLINEKFPFICPDGKERVLNPMEYAIIHDDFEACRIILEAKAFNRQTALPVEALKLLGPQKALRFIELYVKMKPCLIDDAFIQAQKDLKNTGFEIGALSLYIQNNLCLDGDGADDSLIVYAISTWLKEEPHDFYAADFASLVDWVRSPHANLDLSIGGGTKIITRLCYMLNNTKEGKGLDKKLPYLESLVILMLEEGDYTMDGVLFAVLRILPHRFLKAVPAEKMEAYNGSQTVRCVRDAKMNLCTLLSKIEQTSQQLMSPYQEEKWKETIALGGNDRKLFVFFVTRLLREMKNEKIAEAANWVCAQYIQQSQLIINTLSGEGSQRLLDTNRNRELISDLAHRIASDNGVIYIAHPILGHTHALLFFQGHLIVCDRRVIKDAHGEKIDGANIKIYACPKQVPEKALWALYGEEIWNMKLPLLKEISLKPQKHSNCSWASDFAPAILVTAQLQKNPDVLLKEGRFDEEIMESMHEFTHSAKRVAIEEYVAINRAALTSAPGYPDPSLQGQALLYTLFKCAVKPLRDPHYERSLDALVFSGLAIAGETVSMQGYEREERESMCRYLEKRYSLAGIKDYLRKMGCPIEDNLSDGEAFLVYLSSPRPMEGQWLNCLVS